MEMRHVVAQFIINEVEDDDTILRATQDVDDDDEAEQDEYEDREEEGAKRRSVESDSDPEDDSEEVTKVKKVNPIRYKYEASLEVEAHFKIPYNLGSTTHDYESKGRCLSMVLGNETK